MSRRKGRGTGRHAERKTDGHRSRQTDREIEVWHPNNKAQRYRQTGRQTDILIKVKINHTQTKLHNEERVRR